MFLQVMPHKISFPWADTPLSSCSATFLVFQLHTPSCVWVVKMDKDHSVPITPHDTAQSDFRHWLLLLSKKQQDENTQTAHGKQACAVPWTAPRYCLDNTKMAQSKTGSWQLLKNRDIGVLMLWPVSWSWFCTPLVYRQFLRLGPAFIFVGESELAQQVLYYWRKLFGMMEKVSCYYSAFQIFLGNLACEIRVRWKRLCSDIFLHFFLKKLFFFL